MEDKIPKYAKDFLNEREEKSKRWFREQAIIKIIIFISMIVGLIIIAKGLGYL